jgi:hypothetical protein
LNKWHKLKSLIGQLYAVTPDPLPWLRLLEWNESGSLLVVVSSDATFILFDNALNKLHRWTAEACALTTPVTGVQFRQVRTKLCGGVEIFEKQTKYYIFLYLFIPLAETLVLYMADIFANFCLLL